MPESDFQGVRIALEDLRPGMILARDLRSVGGLVLVPATYALSARLIEGLRQKSHDPVEAFAYVESHEKIRRSA
ncbi:MAG: hypothetical protein ACI80V_000977 [Rhodothermales bacterium]|jgi:hypothetical protein